MPTRAIQLALEELDARTMPSVAVPYAVTPTSTPLLSTVGHTLQGTATGNYVERTLVVDAGIYDTLTGTASLGTRGSFALNGWLQGVGLIAHGQATGQIVLSNNQGTITLTLHGPVQSAFSTLPATFTYTITGGTGAYRHLTDSGTVGVKLIPAPTAFGLPPQGIFNMTFA